MIACLRPRLRPDCRRGLKMALLSLEDVFDGSGEHTHILLGVTFVLRCCLCPWVLPLSLGVTFVLGYYLGPWVLPGVFAHLLGESMMCALGWRAQVIMRTWNLMGPGRFLNVYGRAVSGGVGAHPPHKPGNPRKPKYKHEHERKPPKSAHAGE